MTRNLVPTDYSKLTDEQLLEEYNRVFNKDKTLSYISNKYLKTNLTKGGKLNHSVAYFHRRMDWRKKYINKLIDYFKSQLPPMKPPPKINEYGIKELIPDGMTDWESVKSKPVDKLYFQPRISDQSLSQIHLKPLTENDKLKLRINELERENQMLKNYIRQMNLKLIPKQQQFIQQKHETMRRNRDFIVDGINEWHEHVFKPKHHQMSFDEWVEFQKSPTSEQDKLIDQTIQMIRQSPLNWQINLNDFNNYGKEKLTPLLIDVLENVVSPLILANQKNVLLSYFMNSSNNSVNGWFKKPINHESWHKLIEALKNKGLLGGDIMTEQPMTSDMASFDYIWFWFDIVGIESRRTYEKTYNDNNRPNFYNETEGSFFAFWNKTDIDLTRYQVMNKNDLLINQRIHKIPCVFYALKLLAHDGLIDNQLLDRTVLRFMWINIDKPEMMKWTSNAYNMKHLDYACQQLNIYCKVHYYDENSLKNEIRTRDVGNKDSKIMIDLALYKEHYFIWEKTKFTRYYIQHYEELKNEKDAYKIVGKRKNGSYQRDSRSSYSINSLELLREMMNQNMFKQMSFKDILDLEDTIPLHESIDAIQFEKLLKSNYKAVGIKYNNGEILPDIVATDEEDIDAADEISDNDKYNYDDKFCNGYSEDELFGCKDNDYLEDCSDVFYDIDE